LALSQKVKAVTHRKNSQPHGKQQNKCFLNGKLLRNEPCVNWLIVDTVEKAPVIYKLTRFRGWVIDVFCSLFL
jgi:hypothetical protein